MCVYVYIYIVCVYVCVYIHSYVYIILEKNYQIVFQIRIGPHYQRNADKLKFLNVTKIRNKYGTMHLGHQSIKET